MITFEEEHLTGSRRTDVLCLLVFSVGVSLSGLAAGPPLGNHEAIVAQGARQIRQGDGWLTPYVNDVPFVRKPPMAFWLAAAGSIAVDPPGLQPPVSPTAARLPSALASLLTVGLVYVLGRSMFNHRVAMVSGAVYASCVGTMFYSHNAQVEMVQALFCTASFAFFWLATEAGRRQSLYLVLFYVSFAFAMLAKAPFPLVAVGLPIAVWWFATVPLAKLTVADDGGTRSRSWLFMHQVRRLKRLISLPGIFLFVLLVLPWPVYVYLTVDNVIDLWRLEFFARYTGGFSTSAKPVWYYLPLALGMLLPFTLSLPEAGASPFLQRYKPHRRGLLFAFTWTVVVLGFLSTSSFKAPRYLIVCVPGLALLLGPTLDRLFLAARSISKRSVYGACALVVVALPLGACPSNTVFVTRTTF